MKMLYGSSELLQALELDRPPRRSHAEVPALFCPAAELLAQVQV